MPLDFEPSIRSVYFNSLVSHPAYSEIYFQGQKYLSKNPFTSTKNQHAQERIQIAMTTLQNGISKERATEQQYVNNLINGIKNKQIKDQLSNKLKNIFKGDNFNYIEFINLINSILLGSDNYEAVLKLEEKRLGELDEIYKKLIDTTDKTEAEIKKEQDQIRNIYLERHSMSKSQYSSFFDNITPTIDYLLAQYITDITDKILKNEELRDKIKQQIMRQKRNDQEIGTYILDNIIEQTKNEIPTIVKAALENNAVPIEELLSKIEVEQFKHIKIHGQKANFGVNQKSSKNIKINKKEKDLTKIIETKGNKLAKLLLDVVPKLNSHDKKNPIVAILNKKTIFSGDGIKEERSIFDLLSNLQSDMDELEQLQQDLKKLKQENDINTQLGKIQDKKSLISKLQQKISTFVHREIKQLLYSKTEEQARILAAEKIREILTPAIVSITGPEYSELIDNFLQNVGENFFSGPKNAKADNITIQISHKKSSSKLKDGPIISAINKALKGTEVKFNEVFQENLPKSGKSTSYSQGKSAWYAAIKAQKEKVLKTIKSNEKTDEEQNKILKQLALQMKESIVVTETVKTFNQYNNDIGFLSGSLGSNIATQVGNFAELFESAGAPMNPEEQQWLTVALVNCSPNTIGSSNKEPLEKYLSIVAGFAVFDEGSAELELLTNQAKQEYLDASPQIMHLYKLNGMYFPGSYILSRIYDNLQKTCTQIDTEMTNNDGAVIMATASEALIGSHKQDEGVARWARVFESALDVTSVSVAFLSGLMDVVNQLSNAFTEF